MTGRRGGALAAALVVTTLLVATGAAAPEASAAPSRDRYALGDSVMLGARSALRDDGFRVDAIESRQAYSGPALLRREGASLPENVVVHLGTNGTYPLSTCKALVRAAGPERRVFLVTVHVPRSWKRVNNQVIHACAAAFPRGRVHVIDWDEAATAHPGWLYGDGIHLKPSGGAAFARLLNGAVDDAEHRARAEAIAAAHGSGRAALEG